MFNQALKKILCSFMSKVLYKSLSLKHYRSSIDDANISSIFIASTQLTLFNYLAIDFYLKKTSDQLLPLKYKQT